MWNDPSRAHASRRPDQRLTVSTRTDLAEQGEAPAVGIWKNESNAVSRERPGDKTMTETISRRLDSPTTAPPRMSTIQVLTLCLCFLVVAADGFDVASVGYVAPLLKHEWALAPAQLGAVFGAGLFGLTTGSFVFGPLADRLGRQRIIALSLLLFALGSLACAHAPTVGWLIALRLLTGVGLGGAMPNAITLSSEFTPLRNRALLVTLMFSGFTLGLAFGGVVASFLIPSFGWRGVFVFGGVFPLALFPIVWRWLPESLLFMAGKPHYAQRSQALVARLGANAAEVQHASLAVAPVPRQTAVSMLFSRESRAGTLLFWLTFFCTLWVYYQISSWLPTVITDAGIDAAHAARVGAMLPIGGTIGSLINARLMDRLNPFFVLAASYVVAAVSIGAIGYALADPLWVYLAVFMAGLGLSGAQTGANVLVASFYTTGARATGVSWALGVGRMGSILGSVTGGLLIASLHSIGVAFLIFALPTIVAAIAMLVGGRLYGHPGARAPASMQRISRRDGVSA
jgi:AAHS family 4-hydroxybenzoate transporter-like MFS transporter